MWCGGEEERKERNAAAAAWAAVAMAGGGFRGGEGGGVLRVDRGSDKSMRRRQGKRNASIASLQLAKQQAAQSASSQPVWCIEVTTKFMVPLPSSEYRWLDFLLFMPKKKVTHACKYFFLNM